MWAYAWKIVYGGTFFYQFPLFYYYFVIWHNNFYGLFWYYMSVKTEGGWGKPVTVVFEPRAIQQFYFYSLVSDYWYPYM